MIYKKRFISLFYLFFSSSILFCSNQEIFPDNYSIAQTLENPEKDQSPIIINFFQDDENWKRLVTTGPCHVNRLYKGQTAGHFAAIALNFAALKKLYEHGETLNVISNNRSHPFNSTGFSVLCSQQIKFNDPSSIIQDREKELFLMSVRNFAQRNPSVVIKPRSPDNMTPAMIVASRSSFVQAELLKTLKLYNFEAFLGRTTEGRTILDVIACTRTTTETIESLKTILNDQELRKFLNTDDIKRVVLRCLIFKRKEFFNKLSYHFSFICHEVAQIFNQPNRMTQDGRCLCCEMGCYCCTPETGGHPKYSDHHQKYWFEYYKYTHQPY